MRLTKFEFSLLHYCLAGVLEEELQGPLLIPELIQQSLEEANDPAYSSAGTSPEEIRWLSMMDLSASPRVLRTGIEKRQPPEDAMIVLVYFLCTKPIRNETDHDRVDWLLTHVFKTRQIREGGIGNIHDQVVFLLSAVPRPELKGATDSLLAELTSLLEEITAFNTFEELTRSGVIARGREIKQGFKQDFFHPEVLAAVVSYNLIFSKKFDQLFKSVAEQARDLAGELSKRDYRYTAADFKKIADSSGSFKPGMLTPKAPAAAAAAGAAAPPRFEPPSRDAAREYEDRLGRLRAMGVIPETEQLKMNTTLSNMCQFVKASVSHQITQIPLPHAEVTLTDWEIRSLATDYPGSDKSFRAEFSRNLRTAVALLACIAEENSRMMASRGTEHLWKKHYDALMWLLLEARKSVETMFQFADNTEKGGLLERALQVRKTATRLEEAADAVTELIQKVQV